MRIWNRFLNRFLKCFRHLYYGKKEKKKAGYGPIKKAMFAPSIWLGQGEKAIKTIYLPLLWLGIGHKRFVFFVVSISQSRFCSGQYTCFVFICFKYLHRNWKCSLIQYLLVIHGDKKIRLQIRQIGNFWLNNKPEEVFNIRRIIQAMDHDWLDSRIGGFSINQIANLWFCWCDHQ